jgi:hypothetical protein
MRLRIRERRRVGLLAAALVVGALATANAQASTGFQVGVTHTQHSADSWRDPIAVGHAKAVLTASVHLQDQALMGWGTTNPEPAAGVYAWDSLDERLSLIKATRGTPILTLCCAPDWMKGGVPGTTDWSKLEVAPQPRHYADYAALAVAAAKRHPEVRTFLVWNELKGFYDRSTNDWNVAAYTALYNTVYDALKRYDRTLKVGGPYVPMDIWASAASTNHPSTVRGPWGIVDARSLHAVQYWLAHAHGYDMVVVDGGTTTKDKGQITGDLAATAYFSAVTTWLRAHTSKPIWWSEFYPARNPGTTPAHGVAVLDAALKAMQRSGVAVAMAWQPEGPNTSCVTCLWTDTALPTGGQKAPYADLLRRYNGL